MRGLRFPHCAQGFRLERHTELAHGKARDEVVFGVTSLPPDWADEKAILRHTRGHWTIEAMHHVRDVTCDEDHSRIRTGSGPQAMAAVRNLVIGLIKAYIPGTVAEAQRTLLFNRDRLLRLVGA